MLKILTLAALLLLLQGCATFESQQTPLRMYTQNPTVVVTVEIDPLLNTRLGREDWLGYSMHVKGGGNRCHIVLKEYPICLGHEMIHCLSGNFHKGHASDDWCYK